MKIATKIWDSGWGAVFLTIHSAGYLYLQFPDSRIISLLGIFPAVLMMFISDQFSNRLISWWAGGEVKRSTKYIQKTTGSNHFYESAGEAVQSRVDEFDQRAYQNNISILSGILIAISAPTLWGYSWGYLGGGIGLIASILSLQLLTRTSIEELNRLARELIEPYKANYETQ